jgi:glutamate-1-semialdehyde 2,1-aminomutase
MIRFTNTGSEGTRTAVRAARAYTGRDKIAKFEGNYHGSDDYFLFSGLIHEFAGADDAPEAIFDCAGIPAVLRDQIVILPYNDAEATRRLLEKHGRDLAAVIVEPVAFSTGGGVPADKEFLRTVRDVTASSGVILIFDEVVTGFRLGLGGAAGYYQISPDLAAIGKALGGGFPLGAFGGKREIMEQVVGPTKEPSEARSKIFHSGTFTGNPVSMAAALASISELESRSIYPYVNGLGKALRDGLEQLLARSKVAAQVTGIGSIYQVHFASHPIRNRRDILRSDLAMQKEFCFGLTTNGVMQPPGHPGVVSASHTAEEVDKIIRTAERVISEMGLI